MGLIMTKVLLKNARDNNNKFIEIEALTDTGSMYLSIPPEICERLELEQLSTKTIVTANDERIEVPYVGPIIVQFKSRNCFTGALVMGTQVLLGMIPLEDLDVIIITKTNTIELNHK